MDQMVRTVKFHNRVTGLIENVKYLDYRITAKASLVSGVVYLRASYPDPDIYSGEVKEQSTRRWPLNAEMTDSEIVATAFKLCITSAEHRCREAFTYKGARIFGPHFDVEDLVKLRQDGREAAGGRG